MHVMSLVFLYEWKMSHLIPLLVTRQIYLFLSVNLKSSSTPKKKKKKKKYPIINWTQFLKVYDKLEFY